MGVILIERGDGKRPNPYLRQTRERNKFTAAQEVGVESEKRKVRRAVEVSWRRVVS